MSGCVKKPAMEKQHVARIELDSDLFREHVAILFNVAAQKLRGIDQFGRGKQKKIR